MSTKKTRDGGGGSNKNFNFSHEKICRMNKQNMPISKYSSSDCSISDSAAIGALPTEAGDGLEDLDTYSP